MKQFKTSIRRILDHCLSLLIVFLLLSSMAAWSGKLLGRDISGSSTKVEHNKATDPSVNPAILSQLGLEPSLIQLTPRDSAIWTLTRQTDDEIIGYLISTTPYAPDVQGFAGPTPLYIYVSADHTIERITAGENAETPSFFDRAYEGIIPTWIGQDIDHCKELNVDAVSGATYTSNALIQNMRRALDSYSLEYKTWDKAPAIGWVRTVAVWAVLLLSLFAVRLNRRYRFFRPIMLLLNVIVLGFWCGQFLSLSLLRGWVSNGLDPLLNLPAVSLLVVAVFTSFVSHKHHYCSWVCPLGSLQTLTTLLPLPKIKVGPQVARFMSRLRFGLFCLLMTTLWLGFGSFILDYEPFTAFMLDAALPLVWVLAGLIVVTSCFIPHLWCRAFCPVGSLLDLSEK